MVWCIIMSGCALNTTMFSQNKIQIFANTKLVENAFALTAFHVAKTYLIGKSASRAFC